jgi:glycosyltransferase involved in cell wall biosynthesis
MKPLVTIITPMYNHEMFVRKCIESVLSQSYTNWEQIIIDDASTDNSLKIASLFAKRDKRIKIIRHKKDWGIENLANTYNQALKKARGKYIAILESDDYWPKNKLKLQMKHFSDPKIVFSFGNCILVNKSGIPIKLFTYKDSNKLLNNNPVGSILNLFYNLKFTIIPVTVIIKKSSLSRIGGFKKDNDYPFADIPTFLGMSIEGSFKYIDEVLGYYRKQQNSFWFNFASKTDAMGRNEVRRCVSNFVSLNHGKKQIRNFHKNTKNTIEDQQKYLKIKRIMKPFSLAVNKIAFYGGVSPMVIIFVFQYAFYKLKKIFK